MKAATEGQQM